MFIKPTNEGSSFGVSRAENKEELIKAIKIAEKFDDKMTITATLVLDKNPS